jgi:phosphoribosylglycinamide formyltransferase-1
MTEDKVRVAVFISGGGTNLQALIDAEANGQINGGHLALVVSNRADAYGLVRAEKAGIPTLTLTKKQCGGQEAWEKQLILALDEAKIELIVLAGFLSILSADFTRRYDKRILNIHPSLIPSFCGEGFYGLKVHEAALAKGVKVTGATVHYVNEIPDGGEILLQKAVPVEDGDTPEILQRRVMEQAEWKLLPAAVEQVSQKILSERSENGPQRA